MKNWKPHPKQIQALIRTEFEVLYGGARGGGKTDAGMVWLMYEIDKPYYRALVIRHNAKDLSDWIDRAEVMYSGTGAKFTGQPTVITFPSGAKIYTGHLKVDDAYKQYQGHEYQRILIEELTQIPTEDRYLKLVSSCRSTNDIKPRVFCTTNPGDVGHIWVRKRFIDPIPPGNVYHDPVTGRSRIFIPATIDDNPTLVTADPGYIKYLEGLPSDLRDAWRYGSWDLAEVKGSYWQEDLNRAEKEERIGIIPYEEYKDVDVWWDLGISDSQTAIFIQQKGQEIRFIDNHTTDNKGWDYYIHMLKERNYNYGTHYLPHDGVKRSPDSMNSFADVLKEAGFKVKIVQRTKDVNRDIQKVREIFSRFWFDKEKCKDLLEAVRSYRREFDDERGVFKDSPLHDWSSHFADALRGLAVNIGVPETEPREYNREIPSYW